MSGVLALALQRQALSRGTVPSAVPVGHPVDSGTEPGQMGQLGRAGQSQLLRPIAARSISTPSRSGRRWRPIACRPAISTPGRDYSATGLRRSLGSRFFTRSAAAGRAKTGEPSLTNGRPLPSSTAGCRANRPKPALSRAASPNGSTAIRCARRPTAASAAGGRARPRPTAAVRDRTPATPGFIRALAGLVSRQTRGGGRGPFFDGIPT